MEAIFSELIAKLQESYKEETLNQLRKYAMLEGIPESMRSVMWKIFLKTPIIDVDYYISLVNKGASHCADKIQKDTHRTFTNELLFKEKVSEESLIRVLNAIIHHRKINYVQGMNVLLGPIIYVMNEVEAFYTYNELLNNIPTYIQPSLPGVKAGCELVDELLQVLDSEISDRLKSQKLNAFLFCYGQVMTFGANLPKLQQVLRLWDCYLAGGFGCSLIIICCKLIRQKDQIMASPSINEFLQQQKDHGDLDDVFKEFKNKIKNIKPELLQKIQQHLIK